jgi:predicted ATPase
LYESLLDDENIIKKSFLEYSQKQSTVSASLKNKIIYSSFDIIQGNDNDDLGMNITTNIDIESRKKRIIEASSNFEIPDLESKIVNYFDVLNRIQNSLKKEQKQVQGKRPNPHFLKALGQWFINSPQLERIDNIVSIYETAQNEIVNDYIQFTKFETLANLYLSENNKKLRIKKNGEIEIELPNGEFSSIYKLSSGEKQIIVMLAQLIFGKKRPIFIIDEPELSLHLGWQEIFVKTIIEASDETQFILATHSPSIVGTIENEKYCVDLTPNSK